VKPKDNSNSTPKACQMAKNSSKAREKWQRQILDMPIYVVFIVVVIIMLFCLSFIFKRTNLVNDKIYVKL
jgi:uncharacterized membrane protein YdfJ with MMPL/SSD domain